MPNSCPLVSIRYFIRSLQFRPRGRTTNLYMGQTYLRAVFEKGSGVVRVLHFSFQWRVFCEVRGVEFGVEVLEQ